MIWQKLSDVSLAYYQLYHASDSSMTKADKAAAYAHFQAQVTKVWQLWQGAGTQRSFELRLAPFDKVHLPSDVHSLSLHNEQDLGYSLAKEGQGNDLPPRHSYNENIPWQDGVTFWSHVVRHSDTFVHMLVLNDHSDQPSAEKAKKLQALSQQIEKHLQASNQDATYSRPWLRVWLPEYSQTLDAIEQPWLAQHLLSLGTECQRASSQPIASTLTPLYCQASPAAYVLFCPDNTVNEELQRQVHSTLQGTEDDVAPLTSLAVAHSKIIQRHNWHYALEKGNLLRLVQQASHAQLTQAEHSIRQATSWRFLARQQKETAQLEKAQQTLHSVLELRQELRTHERTVDSNLRIMEDSLLQLGANTLPTALQRVHRDIKHSQETLNQLFESSSKEIDVLGKISSLRNKRVQQALSWLAMVFLLEKLVKFTTTDYSKPLFATGQPFWVWLNGLAPFAQVALMVVTGVALGYWLLLFIMNFPRYSLLFFLLMVGCTWIVARFFF